MPLQASTSSRRPLRRQFHVSKRVLLVVLGLLILAVVGYLFWAERTVTVAETMAADKQLAAEVASKVVVPQDETPAISTVVDAAKIDQEFLRGTKKGDKILLYFQARRAIVYRPSTGQVINTGPLDAPRPKGFIRSGYAGADTTKVAALLTASQDYAVDSTDASPQQSYKRTIVVDLAGNRPDVARQLAARLKATVAPLPDGESKPDADLLVVVGAEYRR
jgi:hypothetical protein